MPDYIDGGNVGYLTAEQFGRFEWAVHDSMRLVPWLRIAGYIRGGDADELRHRSNEMPLGLPPTWIAAEEITRLLNELNQWPELENAANDEYGAWVAEELTREVETAKAKWPFEDRPHRVNYLRCQACDRMSLTWHPPRGKNDMAIVRCRDHSCRAVMDERMFEFAAKLIEHEKAMEKAAKEKNRAGRLGDGGSGGGAGEPVAGDDLPVGGGWEGGDVAPGEGAVA